ncbi:LacI family DNA-binding transcriptional regulator [Streptomyces sp. NBC_01506]|uniref:LacI family DNA-binding transcriptional regulator n=1 Tax=Streptomyces sp. NBC_01506 TaxID=2903887 RepID=UPI0038688607
MASKVTRADVARMAGVSPAVVSYVTNGGPRPVSAAARARVEAAIEALRYRPDALATAFRDGRTMSVGLLMPSPMNPYYAEMAQAVEVELVRRGYVLSIGISAFNAEQDEAQIRSFEDRRTTGLLIASAASLHGNFAAHQWSTPHVVLDDVTEVSPESPSVYTDSYYDVRRAVDHLQYHGHSAVACVAGPPTWPDEARRVQAWRDQQSEAGFPAGDDLVGHADVSAEGGSMALRVLLEEDSYRRSRRERMPTAVVVTSDVQAFGVLRVCHELGIGVPDDLAIISCDGVRQSLFGWPRLTSMRRPLREVVRTSISLLTGSESPEARNPAPHISLRGNLLVGESCGCEPTIQWSGGMS